MGAESWPIRAPGVSVNDSLKLPGCDVDRKVL